MFILGALFIEVLGSVEDGEMFLLKQLCYMARDLKTLFLSQGACKDLGLIAENFPKIGSCLKPLECKPEQSGRCQCPRRGETPAPT